MKNNMKNNIRYKRSISNTSVIIFLIGSQLNKNSQRWYFAWENLQGGFLWCSFIFILHFVVVHSSVVLPFVVVLHSFPGYFVMSSAPHPGFSGLWRPLPALSSTLTTFDCPFAFSSTASATVLSGHFLPTSLYYLRSFTDIFNSAWVCQGLPGSRQFFLKVCRASYWWSSKHRPGPSVCLIDSNPQSLHSEEFIFKFYQILSWITSGKKFSSSAPYSLRILFACSKYM